MSRGFFGKHTDETKEKIWYEQFKGERLKENKTLISVFFNNLRILNGVTPSDTYILNYKWHWDKWGDKFYDVYSLCWQWGIKHNPQNILEIGSRTGLSLSQLLSACPNYENKRVVLFDMFDDGLSTPELIKKHLSHLAIDVNPEFYTGDSRITVSDFIKTNTDKFDWLLVDGAHCDEVASIDLENAYQLVAQGGVIVMDDLSATVESDGFDLMPTWKRFQNKYLNEFNWYQNLNGKGVGWAVKK
jgi:predicted O-methyltransferase YrrM